MQQLRAEVQGQLDLLDAMEAATMSLMSPEQLQGSKPSSGEGKDPAVKAELPETTHEE